MNNMGNCITSSKEAYHPDEHLSNTLRGLPPTNLELKKRMELADVLKADKAMRKDGDPWFVVEAAWVHRWLAYVQGNDKMKHPGPIDNSNLLLPPNSEDPRWKPKPVLRAARKEHMGHYRRINHKVWELWQNTYVGSGPAIWVKTEPFENVANWEIEPGLTGEQTTVAPVGRGQGAQGNAGNGAGREEPSRLWPPSSQELAVGEMEDGTVGNETKAKAEAFFNTGMETTTQDERVGGVGGAFSSTSSAGTVAVNGPFTALSINQGNESTQTSGEIGRGPNAESAVGKASKDIEAWMFGDGSE